MYFYGVVRAVPSGDTLLLLPHPPVIGPEGPVIVTVCLDNVRARRVSRLAYDAKTAAGAGKKTDQPFGWAAREFVRKLTIGKRVRVMAVESAPERVFGRVSVPGVGDVAEALVAAGLAEVSVPKAVSERGAEPRAEIARLVIMADAAEQGGAGMHAGPEAAQAAARVLAPPATHFELHEQLQGAELDAIVEEVRTGSILRVLLRVGDKFAPTTVHLAGAQAPGYRRSRETGEFGPEPFARESKFFVEQAILHRDVKITVFACDQQALYASVVYGGRDVAVELIGQGLATFVPWSAARIPNLDQYQQAEGRARQNRVRCYASEPASAAGSGHRVPGSAAAVAAAGAHANAPPAFLAGASSAGYSGAPPARSLPRDFSARVVEIVGPAAVKVTPLIALGVSSEPVVVYLSSVRAPFTGPDATDVDRAYVVAGRELLRKKLIGKKVSVSIDYEKPLQSGSGPPRLYATVIHDQKNMAVILADHGFVRVSNPGNNQSTNDRSKDYESLVLAEERARKAKAGLHGPPGKAPIVRVNDLTGSGRVGSGPRASGAASSLATMLQRKGRVAAVVEWVINPSRLKLAVPSESVVIMCALAGVKTPRLTEPSGPEALSWMKDRALQRDVQLEVISFHSNSAVFSAHVYTKRSDPSSDLACAMLELGLASIDEQGVWRTNREQEYRQAEARAKDKRIGVWVDYDEVEEAAAAAAAAAAATPHSVVGGGSSSSTSNGTAGGGDPAPIQVLATEIVDAGHLWLQCVGPATVQLDQMMQQIGQQAGQFQPLVKPPKKHELVLAQFSADKCWYRARVEKRGGDQFFIRFVDYGNAETVGMDRMRVLPDQFSVRALPPVAHEARLAHIRVPGLDEEWGVDAAEQVASMIRSKPVSCVVESTRAGVWEVTLGDQGTPTHVNAALLQSGLALLQNRPGAAKKRSGGWCAKRSQEPEPSSLKHLAQVQDQARTQHLGLFRYGDPYESDE